MRLVASFAALVLLPAPLLALDFSFSGQRPAALDGRELKIATGVDPAEPVVIDFPDATTARVRQVKDDEDPSPAHPFYRFEWLSKDKSSARFFPVTPQAQIDRLRKLNDASTATAAGRALERSLMMAYINKGVVIQNCMGSDKDKEIPDAMTLYVTLAPGQAQPTAVAVPESSLAECVLTATERGAYPTVTAPITARERFALSREAPPPK